MTEIQFLTEKQINGIIEIVSNDTITPEINKTVKQIEESEEYKNKYSEIEKSDEIIKKYKKALERKNELFILKEINDKLKDINENYSICDYDSYDVNESIYISEDIEEHYQENLRNIHNSIRSKTLEVLNILSDNYMIIRRIERELETYLRLVSATSSLDTIIQDINNRIVEKDLINKHIRIA